MVDLVDGQFSGNYLPQYISYLLDCQLIPFSTFVFVGMSALYYHSSPSVSRNW